MPSCSKAKNPQGIEIIFTEDDHKYRSMIDGKEISYVSGTTFLGKFFKPFDPTGIITARCAKKEGITVAEMKARWAEKGRQSCIFGTRVHETCEDVFNNRMEFRNKPNDLKEELTFKNAKTMSKAIMQKLDIVGIEMIVFSHKLQIAGTIDLFCKSKKEPNTFVIIDHKTNQSIDTENKYKNFALDPISHVPDTNFWHYGLQLNLYQYLLKYSKYIPHDANVKMFLNHITEEKAKLIELPDLQLEIRDMIIDSLIRK